MKKSVVLLTILTLVVGAFAVKRFSAQVSPTSAANSTGAAVHNDQPTVSLPKVKAAEAPLPTTESGLEAEIDAITDRLDGDDVIARLNQGVATAAERAALEATFMRLNQLRGALMQIRLNEVRAELERVKAEREGARS